MRRLQTLGVLAVVSIALGILRGDDADRLSIKLPFDVHGQKGGHGGNTTIVYHGGPVLLNTVTIYVIYYGNFGTTVPGPEGIINDFFANLSNSGQYDVNQTYYNAQMLHISGALSFFAPYHDDYSQGVGTTLGSTSIPKIIKAAIVAQGLPADPNGVYFVITSPDQKVSGFCRSFCAYHTHTTIDATDIKYALVPDPGQACTGCDGNVAVFHQSTTPNGDRGADEVTDSAFHELSESVTDPDLNAWYTSNGAENGDLCNFNYGTTYTAKNGSTANALLGPPSPNGRDYLIQTIWKNVGAGSCANVFP